MGYHVLLSEGGNIIHTYVETLEKLATLNIDEHTLIYEGEWHWSPVLAHKNSKYERFAKKDYRAGILAEFLFMEQAEQHGCIVEPITQDMVHFQSYKNVSDGPIKRGDFLIRNAGNLEIEVKCLSLYKDEYFYFAKDEFEKLLRMSKITGQPIVVIVYHKLPEPDCKPDKDTIYSFEIGKLDRIKNELEPSKNSYKIPIGKTQNGFSIIEKYLTKHKKKIAQSTKKEYL